jgi:DNA gyrase/topoisomerase IV subunit B
MAMMYPKKVEKFGNDSEKQAHEILSSLPETYKVIYEPIIGTSKRYTPDFILLSELNGLVVLEVKSAKHIAATSKKFEEKTLTIAEGDSAVSGFLAARNPISDGSYALRGKILNTNGIKKEEIAHNKELADLMGIIGLDLYSNSINEDPQHLYEISIDNQNFIVSIDDEILLNNKKYFAKDFINN